MSNPGPYGGNERLPTGPDHDPLAVGEVPPAAVPPAPAYEPTELLDPTPEYDSLAEESALTDPMAPLVVEHVDYPVSEAEAVTGDSDYHLAPNPSGAGALSAVKTFAADKPAAFIGIALAAGWLVGKILLSSSDDE